YSAILDGLSFLSGDRYEVNMKQWMTTFENYNPLQGTEKMLIILRGPISHKWSLDKESGYKERHKTYEQTNWIIEKFLYELKQKRIANVDVMFIHTFLVKKPVNTGKVWIAENDLGGKRKTKKVRKHKGIVQTGGKKGKLRKGYRYSGKKLKSGLPQIIKCKSKKC
ncbi:uncharacterized protein METZ01_LOCUS64084, partial [marine metagenome]